MLGVTTAAARPPHACTLSCCPRRALLPWRSAPCRWERAVGINVGTARFGDALAFGFGAPESELRAVSSLAWGAGEEISAFAKTRAFLVEASLALAAAPCAWRLTEYLWSPARRARAAETAALAPLNVLVAAAAESRAARTLAVTSLACAAAQHVAQRSAKRAGMRAL